MKTNDEIRRLNLLVAIKRAKTATRLAEMAEASAANLSQIKNKTPDSKTGKPKGMGDELARRIENAIGEPKGWIDTPHPQEWIELGGENWDGEVPEAEASIPSAAEDEPAMDISGLLKMTCETAEEFRLLTAYRFGGESGRVALEATVEEIHNRLRSATRRKA